LTRNKKKNILVASLAGIVLVAILILVYPAAKLEVISRYYQWYGSYVYFPGETAWPADTTSVGTETRSAAYRAKGVRLTNVLYYPGLRQLSVGSVYGDEQYEKYEIALVDSRGQNVPGVLLVSGGERFRARYLQKLNFMLEEPLGQQETYTILVLGENGARIGSLDFAVRLR